ncbi:hypothetical protein AB0K80_22615 [Streptomyces sp. NPDC052682]|uniref:hypothetical protein n=1 Tax=Streptomyces sp. NPDC052682 TaxID=3154954 RepID=UPI003437421F
MALLLEEARGQAATGWPLARHVRRLGTAQAAARVEDRPWLSRRFLRGYVGSKTQR